MTTGQTVHGACLHSVVRLRRSEPFIPEVPNLDYSLCMSQSYKHDPIISRARAPYGVQSRSPKRSNGMCLSRRHACQRICVRRPFRLCVKVKLGCRGGSRHGKSTSAEPCTSSISAVYSGRVSPLTVAWSSGDVLPGGGTTDVAQNDTSTARRAEYNIAWNAVHGGSEHLHCA